MKMKNISITEKLILYFVCLGTAIICIIGYYSFYFSEKAILNRTFDQLTSLRLEKKNRIEQFFLDRVSDINLISKSDEIKKIFETLDSKEKHNNELNNLLSNSYLSKYISSNGYYEWLHIVKNNDVIYDFNALNTEYSGKSFFKQNKDENLINFYKRLEKSNTPLIQDISIYSKSKLLIYIGIPIFNKTNNFIGAVILEVPLSAINKIMFDHSGNNGLGNTGETYLVGSDHLMRSNSRFKENAIFNIKVNSTSVVNAYKNITGNSVVYDYRNIKCLSSYSKVNIEGLNWVILAEIDLTEAMKPIYAIRNSILLISLFIASVVFFIAFIVSRRITTPLKNLEKASKQIGNGNYDVKLDIETNDEIGQLTATFNEMIKRIKNQTKEIQDERKQKVISLIDGQEMERQRLSRELHDGLGQSLAALKIGLEKKLSNEIDKPLGTILNEMFNPIIDEVRNMSNNLMPAVLSNFGLVNALRNLCDEVSENSNIDIGFESNISSSKLDEKTKTYLFRIAQEVINNSVKHSNCSLISLSLINENNIILLKIVDNGCGFDINNLKNAESKGLSSIRERANILNGDLKIISEIGKGTELNLTIKI